MLQADVHQRPRATDVLAEVRRRGWGRFFAHLNWGRDADRTGHCAPPLPVVVDVCLTDCILDWYRSLLAA